MRAVAQVRGKLRAGLDRVLNLTLRGRGMADGGHDALPGEPLNEGHAPGRFRGHGHQPDGAAGRLLKAAELIAVGRADVLAGVRAARPVLRRNVRPFQVDAGDGRPDLRVARGLRRRPQAGLDSPAPAGDDRRQEAGDAGGPQAANRAAVILHAGARGVEVHAGEAIHLQVDQARRQPVARPADIRAGPRQLHGLKF